MLKASRNRTKLACFKGNTKLPLNKATIRATLALSSTIKRLVLGPCFITRPNPRVRCIYSRICISPVLCVMTKIAVPRLFTIKLPSPSVNPTNHSKNDWLGNSALG